MSKPTPADGTSTIFLEFGGSIIQLTKDAEVCLFAFGERITRRMAMRLDVVTGDGMISPPRKRIN